MWFTVLTATYNRRHTLDRLFGSLRAQTFRDFEWLVVDDGSQDGTEQAIRSWQGESEFPVRYSYQKNQGKHVALNRGVREAAGELLLIIDSDDACVPDALERFKYYWETIPAAERRHFSTITALCVDDTGKPIGPAFPAAVIDVADPCEQMKLRRPADRWGVNRTDVLRDFPFPEIPGEKFLAESIVWARMALHYRTRFINERLRIVRYRADGLSASSLKLRTRNPLGARLLYQEAINHPAPISWKLKDTVNYVRFSCHAGLAAGKLVTESGNSWLTAGLLPAGYLMYLIDRSRL
jgi:glycosyltransferase involved in cell wall biosynthesis